MTKAKFKKRTRMTGPDTGLPPGPFLVGLAILFLPPVVAWASGAAVVAVFLGAPGAIVLALWAFGRLLLLAAVLRWRPRGIRGVLVSSESPVWQPFIEAEWLPKFGARFVRLDWSQRKAWPNSLAVLLWRHFCGHYDRMGVYANVNPAVIVLRGLRRPLVFRFFKPFQAAKHGDAAGLKALERELLEALGD